MTEQFRHRQAAHCESGVISSMLTHSGLPMSEPMAFGLSSALAFAYIPFIKLSGMPLIGYRMPPKSIIRGLRSVVGFNMRFATFRNQRKGMDALDAQLDQGRLVGLQASVFWLPYFPADMRFHFNAHNLLVYGREGDDYLISDPVFEEVVRCPRKDLQAARFAKGALAAKGLMYFLKAVPPSVDLDKGVAQAIRKNLRTMTKAPLPIIGIKGIRHLANNIRKLGAKGDERYLKKFLLHVVRMQEEIGTGGAGFRFMYAAFLQEVFAATGHAQFQDASRQMTEAGDQWRDFALHAAKMCKGREPMDVALLGDLLNRCADKEQLAWAGLARL